MLLNQVTWIPSSVRKATLSVLSSAVSQQRGPMPGLQEVPTNDVLKGSGLWTALFANDDLDGFLQALLQLFCEFQCEINESIPQENMHFFFTNLSYIFTAPTLDAGHWARHLIYRDRWAKAKLSGSLHHIYSFGTSQDRQAPTLATCGNCQIWKGFVSDKNT